MVAIGDTAGIQQNQQPMICAEFQRESRRIRRLLFALLAAMEPTASASGSGTAPVASTSASLSSAVKSSAAYQNTLQFNQQQQHRQKQGGAMDDAEQRAADALVDAAATSGAADGRRRAHSSRMERAVLIFDALMHCDGRLGRLLDAGSRVVVVHSFFDSLRIFIQLIADSICVYSAPASASSARIGRFTVQN